MDRKAVRLYVENALAKEHTYITIFVDLMRRLTIHVSEGRGSETVHDFVEHLAQKNGYAERVKEVSCDMSLAFIKGIRESLPEAQITFDKFHILKLINEAEDKVRRAEAKEHPLLKGCRYALLKNDENLTIKQKKIKTKLCELNLKSMRAVRMRETFQKLYLLSDLSSFEKGLKAWYFWLTHRQPPPMIKSLRR